MPKTSIETVQLRWLITFLAVAEGDNQSEVARRMGVDQSTASQYLRKLGKWLHCSLFKDSGRLELTPGGKAFVPIARKIVHLLSEYRLTLSPDDGMSLMWLQAFLEVVKTQSFTEAGKNLGWSQSTVTRYVKHLNGWAGAKLVKGHVDPVMTKEGQRLAPIAQAITDIIKDGQIFKQTPRRAQPNNLKNHLHELYVTLDNITRRIGPMDADGQKNIMKLQGIFSRSEHAHKRRIRDETLRFKLSASRKAGRDIDMEEFFLKSSEKRHSD